MSPKEFFIGLWAAWLPGAPFWAVGSAWRTLKGRRSTFTKSTLIGWPGQTSKKEGGHFPLPEFRDMSGKYFKSSCNNRSSQAKSDLDPWIVSAHNFGGDKIWNHVLYLTPLVALKMSDKEGATVNTVFCSPLICVPNPEKSKNVIFSPWGCEDIQNDMV